MDEPSAEAAALPADPPAPPAVSGVVRRALDSLDRRCAIDMVFAEEVAPFRAAPLSAWSDDGLAAICEVGPRRCVVERGQVVLSHTAWTGSKRIPL